MTILIDLGAFTKPALGEARFAAALRQAKERGVTAHPVLKWVETAGINKPTLAFDMNVIRERMRWLATLSESFSITPLLAVKSCTDSAFLQMANNYLGGFDVSNLTEYSALPADLQGKLVSVFEGCIFDVAVDIRPGSSSFGRWAGVELSARNNRQLYIPEGFAHGFLVLSDTVLFHYHCTAEYVHEYDAAIAWNDPDIAVRWPCQPNTVSSKDQIAPLLRDVPDERLPRVVTD